MALIMPGYHFGLVVADIDESKENLGALLGLEWCEPMNVASHHLYRGEVIDTHTAPGGPPKGAVYSKQGPPYLELIEQQPDTLWAETGLHHIGVWVDDVQAESARLEAAGCPMEAVAAVEPDGTWIAGCHHLTTDGLRVEIVDIGTSGPKLARYLNGGEYR